MNIDEYMKTRVEQQIEWYEKKPAPASESIPSAKPLKLFWLP